MHWVAMGNATAANSADSNRRSLSSTRGITNETSKYDAATFPEHSDGRRQVYQRATLYEETASDSHHTMSNPHEHWPPGEVREI